MLKLRTVLGHPLVSICDLFTDPNMVGSRTSGEKLFIAARFRCVVSAIARIAAKLAFKLMLMLGETASDCIFMDGD